MKAFFKDPGLIRFCSLFDATAEESPKKYYKPVKHYIQDWDFSPNKSYDSLPAFQVRAEEVDGVAIHIPAYKMQDFIDAINERNIRAVGVRHKNIAVKKAYDNYILMLKIAGEEVDAGH